MSFNKLIFDNRFLFHLPADNETANYCRSVENAAYSWVNPQKTKQPSLVAVNQPLANLLGLTQKECLSAEFVNVFSGNTLIKGMRPYSLCYGGHQFGQWAGQLGDGRAINLGEVVNQTLGHQTLQLKGAGKTPYSRNADGLAVLRSSIREYLCSEAMFHLGIPTTRALSLCLTGDQAIRDKSYDGNASFEPCAVVCRISPSFLRFGSIQLPASRGDHKLVKKLVEFSINYDYPHLLHKTGSFNKQDYLNWFSQICDRTSTMVVHWMRVGFVHGVMNTDNMSLIGETIDYGPYGWIDDFDLNWTPNSSDNYEKRYRFGEQLTVSEWNLFQLANAILPLIGEAKPLQTILNDHAINCQTKWQNMMAKKLGFKNYQGADDLSIFHKLEKLLVQVETDMTIFYRLLSRFPEQEKNWLTHFSSCYYQSGKLDTHFKNQFVNWLTSYQIRLKADGLASDERTENMNAVNPKYVLRNYLSQQVIERSERGDHSEIEKLQQILRNPYAEQPEFEYYAQKRPQWAKNKPGCSTLSCSS